MGARWALAAGGSTLAALAVAISCGFPDPALVAGDASVVIDGGPDSPVAQNDASDTGVDAPPCTKPCDCDEDGFLAIECDGGDCDDRDPRRNPNAGFVLDPPPLDKHKGDWNCNGVVEKEGDAGTSCAGLGAVDCPNREGFEADPACGQTANYIRCSFALSCTPTVSTKPRGCR